MRIAQIFQLNLCYLRNPHLKNTFLYNLGIS